MSEDDLPSDWDLMQIKDVVTEAINGGTPKRSQPDYWEGDIPWLSSSEVRGKYTTENPDEWITEKGLKESSANIWPQGTVLVAMYGRGTIGRPAIASRNQTGNQAICGLIADPSIINNEFLYYWLESVRDHLAGKGRGATASQQNLNQSLITETPIPIPPIDEQELIIGIIEEKLEVLNGIEESVGKLEDRIDEYRQSVSAFLISGHSDFSSGTVPTIPSEDDLPGDWEYEKISDVCIVNKNNCNLQRDYPDSEFKYVSVSDIEETHGEITSHEVITGSDAPSRAKRKMAEGDTIVSTVRPYLRGFAQVSEEYHKEICSTAFAVLTPRKDIHRDYLYRVVRSPLFVEQLKREQRGASYPAVGIRDVKSTMIPVPPKKTQQQLASQIEELESSIKTIQESIDHSQSAFEEYYNSLLFYALRGRISELSVNGDIEYKESTPQIGREL